MAPHARHLGPVGCRQPNTTLCYGSNGSRSRSSRRSVSLQALSGHSSTNRRGSGACAPLLPQQTPAQQQQRCVAAQALPAQQSWRRQQQQQHAHVQRPLVSSAAAQPFASRVRQQRQGQPGQPSRRRRLVIAAGRRRRTDLSVGAEGDEPELDMDDVMYGGGAAGVSGGGGRGKPDDDLLGGVDDGLEEEEYEFDDDDEFDEDDEAEEVDADVLPSDDSEEPGTGAAAGRRRSRAATGAAAAGDDDAWDAALVNFDADQDAAVVTAPTAEELALKAALELVRYDEEEAAEVDGTSLVVTDLPPAEPDRPKTFAEQASSLSERDREALEGNMASYTVFPLHNLDLLVSSTPDGRLNLADCFALDTQKDEFLRPDIGDGVPSEPRLYTPVPWEHIAFKELLKGEEDEHMIMKLYFAALQPAPPHDVDLSQLYCFDVSDRELTQRAPRVLGGVPLDQMVDPVMRIREDGVFVEESARLPGTYFIAEGFAPHPAAPYDDPESVKDFDYYDFVKMGLWDKPRPQEQLLALAAARAEAGKPGGGGAAALQLATAAAAEAAREEGYDADVESQLEERLEELELMEELDDMPDVPAVDMM